MVPEYHFAVVILANRTASGRLYSVMNAAMDILLPVQPAPAESVTAVLPMTAEEIENYVGTYINETAVELALKDGRLVFKEEGTELPVTKVGERHFSAGPPDASDSMLFRLVRGSSGNTEFFYKRNMVAYRKVWDK